MPSMLTTREDRGGMAVYVFGIHLQGERETVFYGV